MSTSFQCGWVELVFLSTYFDLSVIDTLGIYIYTHINAIYIYIYISCSQTPSAAENKFFFAPHILSRAASLSFCALSLYRSLSIMAHAPKRGEEITAVHQPLLQQYINAPASAYLLYLGVCRDAMLALLLLV